MSFGLPAHSQMGLLVDRHHVTTAGVPGPRRGRAALGCLFRVPRTLHGARTQVFSLDILVALKDGARLNGSAVLSIF